MIFADLQLSNQMVGVKKLPLKNGFPTEDWMISRCSFNAIKMICFTGVGGDRVTTTGEIILAYRNYVDVRS